MNRKFISTVDQLGVKPGFFIRQSSRDTSILGACLTILVGLGSFGIAIYFSVTFLNGSGMTVISQKDNIINPITYNMTNKLLMFRFMNSLMENVDPRIASLSFHSIKSVGGREINTTYALEPCKFERHFPKNKYRSQIKNVEIKNYFCVEPEGNLTLFYNNFANIETFFAFSIDRCVNETRNDCYPKEIIDFYLSADNYFLSFYIENNGIDHYNRTNPFNSVVFSSTIAVTPFEIVDFGLFYNAIDYKSDNGLLLSDWKPFQGFQFDNSLTTSILRTNTNAYLSNSFCAVNIAISKISLNIYSRDYPKVPSVLADISALIKILILIGEMLVHLFSTGLYYVTVFSSIKTPMSTLKTMPKMNVVKNSKPKQPYEVQYQKINICESAQWRIIPRLTKKTIFVQNCKRTVTHLLSVEYIINKLLVIESMNSSIKKGPNWQNACVSTTQNSNVNLVHTLHDNLQLQQYSKYTNTVECLK